MNAQDKATKFEAGKVYFARSTGDYDSIAEIKIVKVTAKQVVFVYRGQEMRRKFDQRENHQRVQVCAGYAAYSNHVVEKEVVEAEGDEKEILEPEIETAKDVAVAIEEQAAEADTLTAEDAPDYRDKEILITMHCPVKGHKVARLVSMNMFSSPDYNADEGWECNIITEDEGERVELIKQWIDERANEQHESNLEFVKYEIVEEGAFAERDLNRQFRLEAEKQNCEPAADVAAEAVLDIQEPEVAEVKPVDSSESEANEIDCVDGLQVKVGDTAISYSGISEKGMRSKITSIVKRVIGNELELEEYFKQECITERSVYGVFDLYGQKLGLNCPLWHCIGGERLRLSCDDKNKVYLLASSTQESEDVARHGCSCCNFQAEPVETGDDGKKYNLKVGYTDGYFFLVRDCGHIISGSREAIEALSRSMRMGRRNDSSCRG